MKIWFTHHNVFQNKFSEAIPRKEMRSLSFTHLFLDLFIDKLPTPKTLWSFYLIDSCIPFKVLSFFPYIRQHDLHHFD